MQSPLPLFRSCSKAKGENRPMGLDDLPPLPDRECAASSVPELQQLWQAELDRCKTSGEDPSLLRVIRQGFTKELILGAFLRLLADGGNVALALILREYVLWLNSDKATYIGIIYAFALMLSNFTASAFLSLSNEVTLSLFQRIRTGATCMVFEKSLHIPADHGAHGVIVALHSTDTAKFKELPMFLHGMLVGPITLIGNMVALYLFVGPLAFLALGLLFVIMFIQALVSSKTGGAISEAHGHSDSRLKAIAEVVQGIRICKLMNWEDKFAARIEHFRQLEVVALRRLYRYRTVISGLAHSVHMVLLLAVFLVAWANDEPIKPENVFPAMALMGSLRHVINSITMGLGKFLDVAVSCKRLSEYYLRAEKEDYVDIVSAEELGSNSLEIKNTDIGYVDPQGDFQPIMSDVTASIPEGKLTLVVGPTGGGKSTLMGAMNGEARVRQGASIRRTRDSVAFVPQEAWIMNDTVRGNIIMGSAADDDEYQRAVVACQLVDDFEQLQDGDDTEIGERGINLSGGQKQRIAFARAVCSGRDIVLMDDPLSAVDSHVCRALFEDCICGALDGRTRVLVTHQVQFLPHADSIIVVKDRSVVFQGTYEELLQSPHSESLGSQTAGGGRASGPASARNGGTPNNRDKPPALSMASPVVGSASPKERKLISEEAQETGGIAAGVYSWYLLLAGKSNIFMCLLFFLIWRIALISVDIWLSLWASKSGGFGKDSYTDREYAMWFGISAAAGLLFIIGRQIFFDNSIGEIAANVHGKMVERLIRCPVSFFDTTPQGRIMNRFSKDLRVMDFVVTEIAIFTLSVIVLAAGYIVVIAVSSVYMIPLVAIVALIYYRLMVWYAYALRAIKRLENVERSPMMAIMSEILGGLPTIRAYGLPSRLVKTHSERVDGMTRALYAGRISQFNVMMILSITGSSILLVLALLAVVMERNDTAGTVSPGATYLALGVTYAATLTTVFGFLMILTAEVDASMSAAERMKEYATSIEQEQDIVYGSAPDQSPPPDKSWPASGSVKFDDVQLRYRPGLPLVLKGISLELRCGEKVGIVGRTGSGKSTIMLALFRIIELAQGAIHIDGRDIATLTLADLRSNITIIPQDPTLFQGTVRSNLDPFNNFDDKEVWDVLRKVGLKERVEANGDGLEDLVEDKGSNFSVGQRQLLCLARALLKRTRILLLDEATASVDFEVDGLIQRTIREEFSSCTVLTIAHRLATIIDSDRVLVLNEGTIAEFDSPATLLNNMSGQFYSMVSNLGEQQFLQLYEAAQSTARSKP